MEDPAIYYSDIYYDTDLATPKEPSVPEVPVIQGFHIDDDLVCNSQQDSTEAVDQEA